MRMICLHTTCQWGRILENSTTLTSRLSKNTHKRRSWEVDDWLAIERGKSLAQTRVKWLNDNCHVFTQSKRWLVVHKDLPKNLGVLYIQIGNTYMYGRFTKIPQKLPLHFENFNLQFDGHDSQSLYKKVIVQNLHWMCWLEIYEPH